MNEPIEVREPFRYRRLSKLVLLALGISLFIWVGLALNDRVLPVKRFSQLTAWYTAEQAEQRFSASYPTDKEIEAYLANATILVSDGYFRQAVYYFPERHHFVQWRNDGSSNTNLIAGEWFTKWYLLPMKLNGRWRVALVYSFCSWIPARDAGLPQDSCFILEGLNLLFAGADTVREYRSGNVFNLSAGGSAPFPLPNRARLSIDGLLAMGKSQRGQ
jgi:hypothetical protein